jgi:hypothetical protein
MLGGLWGRGAAARVVCSAVILLTCAAAARAQCPTSDNIGWARGSTVRYFLNANLSAEQRRQARWALAEWSRANSVNNARVRFEEDLTGQNFQFHLLNGQLDGSTPAFANKTFTSDGTVVSATLTYDPNARFPGTNTLIADPNQVGFDTFYIKITLHEVGHTMGLDHPPVPGGNACNQPDGASVMNYICNVNDRSDNMPLRVTECDQSVINGLPRYPAFNQSPNPIDDSQFFVRQHYLDFLNREPDAPGLQFWASGIDQPCGANAECRRAKRVDTSAAFFLSIEFQETGYFVYRVYQAAFGDIAGKPVPVTIQEFLPETQQVGRGVVVGQGNWQAQLDANKNAFVLDLVQRTRFRARYPTGLSPTQFVDALNANAGSVLDAAERQALITDLTNRGNTDQARADVLRRVAEDANLVNNEFRAAFVLMQYFGYLRRNPDDPGFNGQPDPAFAGFNFWLDKLNQFNGDWRAAEMVRAFIESLEYRRRFGQ